MFEPHGFFVISRSVLHPKPEYTEEAILHGRTWINCPSLPDTLRPAIADFLAMSAGQRVRHSGLPED
jgi:hypothetical protein